MLVYWGGYLLECAPSQKATDHPASGILNYGRPSFSTTLPETYSNNTWKLTLGTDDSFSFWETICFTTVRWRSREKIVNQKKSIIPGGVTQITTYLSIKACARKRLMTDGPSWRQTWKLLRIIQGSLYYQPKQCTVIGRIPQNHHTFALFDPHQNGSHFMTPDIMSIQNLRTDFFFLRRILGSFPP